MKAQKIEDAKLDELLKAHENEKISWDRDKVIIDGIYYYRASKFTEDYVSNKVNAQSLIKAEPAFDYSFMDDIYKILDENEIDHIRYALPNHIRGANHERDCQYMLDLFSAYPHILQYEKMPIDGDLYTEESPDRLNFYLVTEGLQKDRLVTNDLADYITAHGGSVKFLFSTDYKIGNKMGERLLTMSYKNEKTKAEAKINWGYYQKKFIKFIPEEDCYARNAKYNHEILMVAIISQLCYILLNIKDITGEATGKFVTDAFYFNNIDVDKITAEMSKRFQKYDYRIYDTYNSQIDDKHGSIIYKTYEDITKAPRNHHKKA